MRQRARLIPYLIVAAALLVAFLASPEARATPLRSAAQQTVPSRTPTGLWVPTDLPTDVLPATVAPATPIPLTATPGQPVATVAPAAPSIPVPSATLAAPILLALTIEPARLATWPGATLTFTLTVTNRSAAAARQLVLEQPLPAGLEPGKVLSGGARWNGRTLRLQAASLASSARLTVVYTVRVSGGVSGAALVLRPVVTASGGARATATAVLALPPTELPPTGAYSGGLATWRR